MAKGKPKQDGSGPNVGRGGCNPPKATRKGRNPKK